MAIDLSQHPRVILGRWPTPLEEALRLSEALGGPRILVKRDDVNGLGVGGNKLRKLEFLLGEALASSSGSTSEPKPGHGSGAHNTVRLTLVIGALGVVFGDIG
ncbi:hypothetical protein ACFQ1S_28930, partial [Kibdelosporangium lantanae]